MPTWESLAMAYTTCPVTRPLEVHHGSEDKCWALTTLDNSHHTKKPDVLLPTIHLIQEASTILGVPAEPPMEFLQRPTQCTRDDSCQPQHAI
ncbi:hypothetical protein Pmani_024322 [Petrolisthes manimaculis]|uniref:Uncharacterized protein n=1 Tax=Petrolisthes manimaculis TaxID=1843537 RepID=A0AAE1TZG8_9EUCA|nr:hypothetical protein Pmani_024322 [Petrolisthes manimaculis]